MLPSSDVSNLHTLSDSDAPALCEKLRRELIEVIAQTGGHLASNLGAVELTVAIHRVFHTEQDRLVFDVGHQCYTHKILTGRGQWMETLRTFGGLSGYPKPEESVHDAFIAGHASNSVSVAVGMARARTLMGQNYHVIALIGDGALTGGLAYEGLSDAGESGEPLIVILNDNGMSITKNVGGVAQHLAHQRLKPQYLRVKKAYRRLTSHGPIGQHLYRFTHKIKKAFKNSILPCSMFEDMGFSYLGPVDGHDVNYLTRLLRYAKEIKGPVLLHVRTVKGKGFAPAEATPDAFHGVSKFHIEDGTPLKPASDNFSKVFGDTLCQLAEKDKRVCAITAAMQSGTGLDRFAMQYPERFFDVGIAEGHAVAMSAGMAKQGMVPVFAVYSSFLQRGYDMLIHDVAIQHLHVIFGIDRAGLVGEDGETHHGIFDVAYLDSVPGMTVLAPSNFCELQKLLPYALYECDGPVAIRYARGGEGADRSICADPAIPEVLRVGSDITLVGYGMMINHLLSAADQLEKSGVSAEVIKITMLTPLNPAPVLESMRKTRRLLVAEDCVDAGSVGRRLLAEAELQGVMIDGAALCNLGRAFVTQGTVAQLQKQCGIDGESLYRKTLEVCERGEKAAGCTAV